MKKIIDFFKDLFTLLAVLWPLVLIVIILITGAILEIYVLFKYGGTPLNEIPMWAIWLLRK